MSSRARFERRAMQVRQRPRRLLAGTLGGLAVLLLLGWVVGFSPLLAARAVTVHGLSDPAERQAVEAAAAIPLGTPLARIDTGEAAVRVGAIPTLRSVSVTRSWPSTVAITVDRKTPVLAVRNSQGQLNVLGSDGVPFAAVDGLPPGVALVNATSSTPDPEGIRTAISVLQLLPPEQRNTVTELTVTSADLVTFKLGSVAVVWGGAAEGPKKVAVLQALLATRPAVVDVSAPDTPVTR